MQCLQNMKTDKNQNIRWLFEQILFDIKLRLETVFTLLVCAQNLIYMYGNNGLEYRVSDSCLWKSEYVFNCGYLYLPGSLFAMKRYI